MTCKTLWLAVLAHCCMGLDVVRRHSDAAVGRDEECGSLAGEHRVAHVQFSSD
jgi:hypothetical protein